MARFPLAFSLDIFPATLATTLTGAGVWDSVRQKGFNSELFQFVVSNGYYAELAMNNSVHFSPDNWTKFENTHAAALHQVDALVPNRLPSIEYGPIPADAIAQTAYSLHFLSDAFSAGHMRVPRANLDPQGSFLAGIMHDFDSLMGLTVENGFNQRWRAFGDSYLQTLNAAQRQRLDSMSGALLNSSSQANRDMAIGAMGAAMKQLHYQAQRYFGDTTNAADFQAVLSAAHGTSKALAYDEAVIEGTPGDPGAGRDAWIALDIPAKIAYMQKHRPMPVAQGSSWRSGSSNHAPLIDTDSAGNPVVDPSSGYRWAKHWLKLNEDRTLIYEGERDFMIDMTKYVLLANNTPDAALSWLGAREVWLPLAMKAWPEDTSE